MFLIECSPDGLLINETKKFGIVNIIWGALLRSPHIKSIDHNGILISQLPKITFKKVSTFALEVLCKITWKEPYA